MELFVDLHKTTDIHNYRKVKRLKSNKKNHAYKCYYRRYE